MIKYVFSYVILSIFSYPLLAAGLDLTSSKDKTPIEVSAENSIEWDRKNQTVTAIQKALAVKGNVSISADKITAKYNEKDNKNPQIYFIDAEGNVEINAPKEKAFGQKALYFVTEGKMALLGNPASIVTQTEKITADDKIEYYQNELKAVFYKNVTIIKDDKKISTEKLTAFFKEAPNGSLELKEVYLDEGIMIETPSEKLIGSKGEYDAVSQIAKIFGNVEIHQGENILKGDYAESNLKTGVSKLKASENGRVKGSIMPDKI